MFDTSNLHPMIVHFPVALIIIGFIFDIAGITAKKEFFHKAGFYLLLLGTAGVIAAYFSGEAAEEFVNETGALETTLELHEEAALFTLWIVTAASLIRAGYVLIKKQLPVLKWISIVLFAVGAAFVARTGYYGGELVYTHAAGVQLNPDQKNSTGNLEKPTDKSREFKNDANESDDD